MHSQKNALETARMLLSGIKDMNEQSIVNACKLVSYDVWARNPREATRSKGPDKIDPDQETIQNIKIMVDRSVEFWKSYGSIVKDGFDFKPNGYTRTVDRGDGDYLTADTIWDFKVSKTKPNKMHTLQLLMYWIMGQHSGQGVFKTIHNIGIFNPRSNEVYLYDTNNLPKEIVGIIKNEIICY